MFHVPSKNDPLSDQSMEKIHHLWQGGKNCNQSFFIIILSYTTLDEPGARSFISPSARNLMCLYFMRLCVIFHEILRCSIQKNRMKKNKIFQYPLGTIPWKKVPSKPPHNNSFHSLNNKWHEIIERCWYFSVWICVIYFSIVTRHVKTDFFPLCFLNVKFVNVNLALSFNNFSVFGRSCLLKIS